MHDEDFVIPAKPWSCLIPTLLPEGEGPENPR